MLGALVPLCALLLALSSPRHSDQAHWSAQCTSKQLQNWPQSANENSRSLALKGEAEPAEKDLYGVYHHRIPDNHFVSDTFLNGSALWKAAQFL